MDTSRDISTKELLLQVMELTSLGAASRNQVAKQLRRAHPFARLDRRLGNALDVLVGEALIESSDEEGEHYFRTTHDGLRTLEQNGRYSAAATVLFTDIVGSTELIDDVGDEAAHVIRQRHFSLLRELAEKRGGRVVKNLGDGLMVIFAKATQAIACASDMQRRVAGDDDQLELRVGLHAGELLRDGNDFFGSTVIIARRLCDSAEAGQTIISSETRALADGATDETFVPLGALELKGLSAPVEAESLIWSQPAESLVG
jgi:class 3 adenylate cyclase